MEYHIAWFDSAHSKQAMLSLLVLPESERVERGRDHLFTMCQNCPYPELDGSYAGKIGHCVYVNFKGAAMFAAGQIRDKKSIIAGYCEPLIEIEPGLRVSKFKEETFSLPEYIAAFKEEEKSGAIMAEKIAALKHKTLVEYNAEIREYNAGLQRRFFNACGHMILEKRNPKTMELDDLTDVLVIAEMNGQTFPQISTWMQTLGRELNEVQEKPYDPLDFLTHVSRAMTAQGLLKRKFQVELDSNGKPIESTRKRIA